MTSVVRRGFVSYAESPHRLVQREGVALPQTPHDEPPSSVRDRQMVPSGPDTTDGLRLAQDDARGTPPTPTSANHEIVANVGRDRAGRSVFLARELPAGSAPTTVGSQELVALLAQAPQTDTPSLATIRVLDRTAILAPVECYVCGMPRNNQVRFCEACGAMISIAADSDPATGEPPGSRAAVHRAVGDEFTIVGTMPATEGDQIFFARDPRADSLLLALVPRSTTRSDATARLILDAMPAIEVLQPSLPPSAPPMAAGDLLFPTPPFDAAAVADDPLVGGFIDGKYRILRKLGQGGMGVVFDARHEQLRARRAIKVMHRHLQARTDLVTRFYEEARNAERVKHEHVCTVHDFGASDGVIYIAMEFVDGEPLSAVIKRDGKLAPPRASVIVAQTAAALDAAHALKIIHRDVKPDNIMLARPIDGRDDVKVVDFGISKALNRSELTSGGTDTQFGVVIGTLDYMSEEQRLGQEVDSRTDVYALGRTAVKMLFGELPEHSLWNDWSRARVNPALAAVLSKALAPRDERYATAGEFSRDLTRVLRLAPPERAVGWRDGAQRWSMALDRLRRRPKVLLAVGGAVVAIAAIAVASRFVGSKPAAVAISATPSSVRFEAQNGVAVPATQEIRVTTSGDSIGPLGVADVQYDSSAVEWLARPTWRNGNAAAPTALILEPRAGNAAPGSHTARIHILSSRPGGPSATIVATLVVKSTETPVDSSGPTDTVAASGADKCTAPRARLARIRRLTDPLSGTTADAQQVVQMVPGLAPTLCTTGEQVEAQLRLAEAYMTLSQADRACGILHAVERRSAATSFAENIRVYLSRCP